MKQFVLVIFGLWLCVLAVSMFDFKVLSPIELRLTFPS